ncbi:enoyl-CoA hydratase-related protein [Streptomyces sp. NPDC096095]|uniref:enoyl-CoA hydratase-related protein n=1 Tax=Streptomyces sp. NPDC096095 TaxID=3155545 RepID=UPI003326B23F
MEGPCVAGGTEILQGTDIRVAGAGATFGLFEVRRGLFPIGGSTVRLPRQIPRTHALEMLLTGRPYTADEAAAIGLIGRVVPEGTALEEALAVAERINACGPLAVEAVKASVHEGAELTEIDYVHTPGRAQSAYLTALEGHRTVGERCPACRKVYVPPRGACPTCGVATAEQVEVGPRGTVTTFCIVNIKAAHTANLDLEVPYVYAHIALDGADLALHGRIAGIPYDQVRMGLRVEPVWTGAGQGPRHPDHYRPTREPDADYDTYKELV